jgi:hypothetical protein
MKRGALGFPDKFSDRLGAPQDVIVFFGHALSRKKAPGGEPGA